LHRRETGFVRVVRAAPERCNTAGKKAGCNAAGAWFRKVREKAELVTADLIFRRITLTALVLGISIAIDARKFNGWFYGNILEKRLQHW